MPEVEKRRRPGYPRKEELPGRITLRIRRSLYKELSDLCKREKITQRECIETAVRAELGRRSKGSRPHLQKDPDVSRTGMWIEPELLKAMDARIELEHSSQRAFIEDALEAHLRKTQKKSPPTKASPNGSEPEQRPAAAAPG